MSSVLDEWGEELALLGVAGFDVDYRVNGGVGRVEVDDVCVLVSATHKWSAWRLYVDKGGVGFERLKSFDVLWRACVAARDVFMDEGVF